jgi:RNA polymerase sigma factor (TIGR02999 family)
MPGDVTQLLDDLVRGDRSALDRLLPLVYTELHRLACACFRYEHGNITLQPTALVHEAYFRLVDARFSGFEGRKQFFGMAAALMRRILVDHARERAAQKRGGCKTVLDEAAHMSTSEPVDLLDLHDALDRLETLDPDLGKIVELRFFGGLSVDETADTLGISTPTVKRRWSAARAWLGRELAGGTRACGAS